MTQYLFLRHAEAASHAQDHERPLTKEGEAQADRCNLSRYPCDLIITSSAKRAVQTAEIIRANHSPNTPLEHVKELYLPQKNPDIQSVLKMLGEANLNQLLAKDREGAWKRYSKEAHEALIKVSNKHHSKHILIIAHAHIINDLGVSIAPKAEELRSRYFAPCTGFLIHSNHSIECIFNT